jgi:hypothetical protein
MSPTAYSVQMAAIEKALKLACEANDLAATLAVLTTKVRLIRLHYAIRVAMLVS